MNEPHVKDKYGYCPNGYADSSNCVQCTITPYQMMIDRVVALHIKGKHGECVGCDNRCGCYEGDFGGFNTWETCPTLEALKGEEL